MANVIFNVNTTQLTISIDLNSKINLMDYFDIKAFTTTTNSELTLAQVQAQDNWNGSTKLMTINASFYGRLYFVPKVNMEATKLVQWFVNSFNLNAPTALNVGISDGLYIDIPRGFQYCDFETPCVCFVFNNSTTSTYYRDLVAYGGITANNTVQLKQKDTIEPPIDEPTVNTATFSQSATNCVFSGVPDSIEEGESVEITVTADSGFRFVDSQKPFARWINPQGGYSYLNGVLESESVCKIAGAVTSFNDGTVIELVASAEAIPEEITAPIVYHTSNVHLYAGTSEPQSIGDNKVLTVQYEFDNPERAVVYDDNFPRIEWTDKNGVSHSVNGTLAYQLNQIPYRASVSAQITDIGEDTVVDVYCEIESVKAYFDWALSHCFSVGGQTEVYDEEMAENPINILLKSNAGYVFNSTPLVIYTNSAGNEQRIAFTVNEDKDSATATIPANLPVKNDSLISIVGSAVAVERQYEISRIHKVTSKDLSDIAKKRYYKESYYITSGENKVLTNINRIDLSQYILSLRKAYIEIASDSSDVVLLGWFNTGILTPIVESPYILFDCGSNLVEGYWKNSNDFSGSVEAVLPFIGVRTLESEKILEKNISIKYLFNLYNGRCCAVIYDDDAQLALYVFEGVFTEEIPYLVNGLSEFNIAERRGRNDTNENVALFHDSPSINVRTGLLPEGWDSKPFKGTSLYVQLKDLSGYNVLDFVNLDGVKCIEKEKEEIMNLILSGVIY